MISFIKSIYLMLWIKDKSQVSYYLCKYVKCNNTFSYYKVSNQQTDIVNRTNSALHALLDVKEVGERGCLGIIQRQELC
jgi:hypothetical protein